jgi:hypothetical protein
LLTRSDFSFQLPIETKNAADAGIPNLREAHVTFHAFQIAFAWAQKPPYKVN